MNQATLQAAHGLDVQQSEFVDDFWITLPTDSDLCATDQGRIHAEVNLKQTDPIMQLTFKELLDEACQQGVPWILSVYGCLTQEGKKRLRYADALCLQTWRKEKNIDPQTREEIIDSDHYRFEYVGDNLKVTYLGVTRKAVVDKKKQLGLLRTYHR